MYENTCRIQHTGLTLSTLIKFADKINAVELTDEQCKKVEHYAYVANMGATSQDAADNRFVELMNEYIPTIFEEEEEEQTEEEEENMPKYTHHSEYFCGNKISEYGLQNGYVDYATLAKAFDAVLANDIIPKTSGVIGYWETVNGDEAYHMDDGGDCITREEYDENGGYEEYKDIYQYYIISANGYSILSDYTDEIMWYNEELDMYVWGVTHWGTSWDYVLTDIKIEREEE